MWLKTYQWNIFKAVLVSATSSVLSGYDQGVIAAAMITMQPDLGLTMTEEEVSIGVLNVAAAFGGLLAGNLADRFGRRLSLALANLLFFVGSLMLAVCEGFDILALGRVIMGLGVGVGELFLFYCCIGYMLTAVSHFSTPDSTYDTSEFNPLVSIEFYYACVLIFASIFTLFVRVRQLSTHHDQPWWLPPCTRRSWCPQSAVEGS